MSDTAYPIYQHYGTAAQRAAFAPSPPASGQPVYIWYETDTDDFYIYTTAWKGPYSTGGGGSDSRLSVVVKSADETVNNSSTLQNDDELLFSVSANKTYLVDLYLRLNGGVTPDFKFAWSLPAGASYNWAAEGEGGSGGINIYWSPKDTAQGSQQALSTTTFSVNGSANTPQGLHLTAILMIAGTAGTATLQWAQNVATVADSKVLANSILRAVTS
jgi:hypothetical protein